MNSRPTDSSVAPPTLRSTASTSAGSVEQSASSADKRLGGGVHWAVQMNHRNRVACAAFLALAVAVHLHDRGSSLLSMVAAVAWFLLYPQGMFLASRRAVEPVRAETRNMQLDAAMLGVWVGLLHFPLWLGAAMAVAAILHTVIFHGNRGFIESSALWLLGAAGGALVAGLRVEPQTSWLVTALSLCFLGFYLVTLTRDAYRSASTAVQLRRQLRESERALSARLDDIERLQAELREQALRDPLTGLYNRRHLEAWLVQSLAQALANSQPISLLMLDVDHFKRINDVHGHQVGDEVLRHVARLIERHVRPEDLVCRYGGEEFLIALPGVDLSHAVERAAALRSALAGTPVRGASWTLDLTASLGVAACPLHALDPYRLIGAADAAMYRAKQAGRDRVCAADEEAQAAA